MSGETADALCPVCEEVSSAEETFVNQDAVLVRCRECGYVFGVVQARFADR
jgi:uncharacterized Zn finger protein